MKMEIIVIWSCKISYCCKGFNLKYYISSSQFSFCFAYKFFNCFKWVRHGQFSYCKKQGKKQIVLLFSSNICIISCIFLHRSHSYNTVHIVFFQISSHFPVFPPLNHLHPPAFLLYLPVFFTHLQKVSGHSYSCLPFSNLNLMVP